MVMHTVKWPQASKAQLSYIECLAIDLKLDQKRTKAHIINLIGKKINYLDELTKNEASDVIAKFLEWKEDQNVQTRTS